MHRRHVGALPPGGRDDPSRGTGLLRDAVAERMRQGPCRFTLLVPAGAPPRLQDVDVMSIGAGYGMLTVAHDPVRAVRELNERAHFDEIVVSTLPSGVSRWLHLDVPHRLERACRRPVTVITASTSPAHT